MKSPLDLYVVQVLKDRPIQVEGLELVRTFWCNPRSEEENRLLKAFDLYEGKI